MRKSPRTLESCGIVKCTCGRYYRKGDQCEICYLQQSIARNITRQARKMFPRSMETIRRAKKRIPKDDVFDHKDRIDQL
jgi:hypothetical protein